MDKVENGSTAFLRQAYSNNWRRYQESLLPAARSGWDVCVLTANDERQAELYRSLVQSRWSAGLLPQHTQFVVLPDPDGQRIGSGGATLRALASLPQLAQGLPPVGERRVLIIHSGGDSKRLPISSATGKLLACVPRASCPMGVLSTVLDEFLISLTGLARHAPAGVLVVSGDVLLIFDHLQLSFQRGGVIGVAAAAAEEMARRHGVYVSAAGSRAVRAYLHKPSPAELLHWNGISADGTVQIDTGLVWFDAATAGALIGLTEDPRVSRLCGLAGQDFARGGIHLYADLLLPLAHSTTLDAYLSDASDGPVTSDTVSARRVIWDATRQTALSVERLQPAVFAHVGTSSEYWRLMAGDPDMARLCSWASKAASWAPEERANKVVLANAAIGGALPEDTSQQALVIDSCLDGTLSWQGAALVAGVQSEQSLALGAGMVVHQLPVNGDCYVTRLFGLQDDPKAAWDTPAATFMNLPWRDWLSRSGITSEDLWPGMQPEQWSLWTALLFPVSIDRDESLEMALPLQDVRNAAPGWRNRWRASERLSLATSTTQADVQRVLDEVAGVEDYVAARRFYDAVVAEQPAMEMRGIVAHAAVRLDRRAAWVGRWLQGATPRLRLRGYVALATATGKSAWEDMAFGTLATMIKEATPAAGQRRANCNQADPLSGSAHSGVRVEAAARIDFGGGWSDTPPYSIERGGTVLNAAMSLAGAYPIIVEAEQLDKPQLVLECRDIDVILAPERAGDVLAYANPADPFALLKAALVLSEVVPAACPPETPLAQVLSSGLRLSTQTTIPRGSGLGTSSILAGAVLTCIQRWQGRSVAQADLFDEVLCLEQMLTTGGGWQDQVGGLVGGIKLVSSSPGLPQKLAVEPVALSAAVRQGLAQRLVLVYTGQQRLAKNLLRNVMSRWMARDPEMVWILERIAALAHLMQNALVADDLATFGQLLTEHWLINKRMDASCTNPFIDGLFDFMAPFLNGAKLAGAGGGGFAIAMARDAEAAVCLTEALAQRYAGTPVAVWPSGVQNDGVRVTYY